MHRRLYNSELETSLSVDWNLNKAVQLPNVKPSDRCNKNCHIACCCTQANLSTLAFILEIDLQMLC